MVLPSRDSAGHGEIRAPTPLSWHEARRAAHASTTPLPLELLPLAHAAGRILAEDLVALTDVPHYPSSAMDGWAVAGPPPWRLTDCDSLTSGQGRVIVTGGLVPTGTRAIIRREYGHVDGDQLSLHPAADSAESTAGRHIRPAGEEAHQGEAVAKAGQVLNPARLALLAASGHDRVLVREIPTVVAVVTGAELVDRGVPTPGRVRNSFSPALPALISGLGTRVADCRRVGDDRHDLVDALGAADGDIVVTTGGTGVSATDHIRAAVHDLDGTLIVDRVAMRPGGPTVLARLGDGRLLVGLPGNPLAAFLSALSFLPPIIAGMAGGPRPELGTVRLGVAVKGKPQQTRLVPCQVTASGWAVPLGWQGAAMMRGLADAHLVAVCPPSGIDAGADAQALPLPWPGCTAERHEPERPGHGGEGEP